MVLTYFKNQVCGDPEKPLFMKVKKMKKWYLVGYLGGMKMLYYIGECENESQAKEKAILRYNIKKKNQSALQFECKE